jgi:hypothetical protein
VDDVSLFQQKWENHSRKTLRTYSSWLNMKARCENPEHRLYVHYGARGISVCPEWAGNYDQFYRDMGDRPDGYTLERINNALGYFKDNCRWATRQEQAQNRRTRVDLTIDGVTKSMSEWFAYYGCHPSSFYKRIKEGVSPEEALKPPLSVRNKKPVHGTNSMYSFYKCRCLPCVAAGKEYRNRLNLRKSLTFDL